MFVEHKEALEVTEAPAKVLKLSDVIRIGCHLAPQSHIGLFYKGATCTQGAALMGLGVSFGDNRRWIERLEDLVGGNPMVRVPDGRFFGQTMQLIGSGGAIAAVNDVNGGCEWSRERIADWLESKGL